MKFLGFRLRAAGWVDNFELRQAAIEAARMAAATGAPVSLAEVRQLTSHGDYDKDAPDEMGPDEDLDSPYEVPIEWREP